MAPSDEEDKRKKAQNDANPFISFRRFADDQMSTLMNGVFSISSLFGYPSTSPHRSVQDYEKWLHEARESAQPHAREAEEAGRIMDVYTRAHEERQHAVQEPTSENDGEPLRCPYRPAEENVPRPERPGLDISLLDDATRSCLSLAALSLRLQSTGLSASVLGEQLLSHPVAYILYSPYSPIRLEQQPLLCDHGAKWREAFEDLLAVQSGKKLPPKYSHSMPESSVDWVRGMIQSAVCKRDENIVELSNVAGKTSEAMRQSPGLLSCFTSARQPENDADEDEGADDDDLFDEDDDEDDDEVTEVDMYDEFFGSQQLSSNGTDTVAPRSFAYPKSDYASSHNDSKSPSILSTLTTTERTTLQDGSVHTKVVLKKRFSDGREESTETVHHQNAVLQTQDAASKSNQDESTRITGKDKDTKENKSSGWFWS